jgi:D-alanine-D-alanine ligase
MDDRNAVAVTEDEEPPASPVAVLYNRDFLPGGSCELALGHEAGEEAAAVAHAVAGLLADRGIPVLLLAVDDDPEGLVAEAVAAGATRAVNLVESLGGDGRREHEVPALLEAQGIPYTGNGPRALLAAQAKHMARRLMRAQGVRLPDAAVVAGPDDLETALCLDFPLFVKPACADGSVGIDQGSVVRDARALRARVTWLAERIPGPYLVETYLPGRELNVAIFPNPMHGRFSVTEIDFASYPKGYAPIVTYDCKWTPDGPESSAYSKPVGPADLGAAVYREVVAQARAAFLAIGGTSYGRVDMRLDASGHPRVIDVNPNPDLDPDAGFCLAARHTGLAWGDLVLALLADARLDDARDHRITREGRQRPALWEPAPWTSTSAQ